jgi:bacterioferritin
MQGDTKVLAGLNEVLGTKLTAINQLYLHGRMGINWGYKRLGKKTTKQSIEAMKDASTLTDRILFLGGLPNLQKLNALNIGENVQEQLRNDFDMATADAALLRGTITLCAAREDHGSREMLEKILVEDEEYVDWLEEQLHLIGEVGLENYLATQI